MHAQHGSWANGVLFYLFYLLTVYDLFFLRVNQLNFDVLGAFGVRQKGLSFNFNIVFNQNRKTAYDTAPLKVGDSKSNKRDA